MARFSGSPPAPVRRAQEKGAFENLVGFVKNGFFKARRFHEPARQYGPIGAAAHDDAYGDSDDHSGAKPHGDAS